MGRAARRRGVGWADWSGSQIQRAEQPGVTPRAIHSSRVATRPLASAVVPRRRGARCALVGYCAVCLYVAFNVTQVERVALDPPASSIAPAHEDVTFSSRDGVVLRGWWFVAAGADRAVVMVHGRARNRVNSDFMPADIAKLLLVHGYSVLLFDLRGHGESGGTRYTLGIEEPREILAAIDLAAAKARVDRARGAVIGESLGGGSARMAVEADPTIGPVVTDSAFADGETVVGEAERAFLFIHCADDQRVLVHHGLYRKAASANQRSELRIVPNCEQVRAFATYPSEWAQHVLGFLSRELGPEKPASGAAGILAAPQRGG